MIDEQTAVNLYDKIRADADKKRQARIEEKRKTDEYFARIKSGYNPLDEINQILAGEKK
jgi:hypothetical protein